MTVHKYGHGSLSEDFRNVIRFEVCISLVANGRAQKVIIIVEFQRGLPAGSARPRTIVGLGIVGNVLAVELNREIKR